MKKELMEINQMLQDSYFKKIDSNFTFEKKMLNGKILSEKVFQLKQEYSRHRDDNEVLSIVADKLIEEGILK